jgi:site-specific recombinase XerC
MLDTLGARPAGLRDRALLLVGFAGAFRRSELVSLDIADLAFVPSAVVITLRRSKTDQEGQGRAIGIPLSCHLSSTSAQSLDRSR